MELRITLQKKIGKGFSFISLVPTETTIGNFLLILFMYLEKITPRYQMYFQTISKWK